MDKYNLEERLINFAVLIIKLTEDMPKNRAANHLAGQLLRSGTSPALNYGEAQGGESKKDFIHKIQIVLKELRESFVCLKIIKNSRLYKSGQLIEEILAENDELIAIFVKSVRTAKGK